MHLPAYLFDLDGTLLDSTPDIAIAANAVRHAFELPSLSRPQIEAHIGWGLRHLLRHILPQPEGDRLERAREIFIADYSTHLVGASRPYDGVERCLEALSSPVALVTNKPTFFTEPTVKALGWGTHFDAVISGDTAARPKPAPDPIHLALKRLGVAADSAVFVGDSEVDQAAAKAAGVPFVAVKWGRVLAGVDPQGLGCPDDRARLPSAWLAPLAELI